MRKISVLLLICILFVNISSVTVFAKNTTDYSYDIEVMKVLGIMTGDDNGDFNPKDCLTRAEFAKIICILDGFDDRTLYTENINYKDLSANHWAYNYICYVSQRGYMTGDDNQCFRPDDCITGNEVTKVLIHLLGFYYKVPQYGGYPTGYVAVADSIGIYNGFKGSTFDYLLREETAKLINNAIDIPVVELLGVGTKYEYNNLNGNTILSTTFNMKRSRGIVFATDSASILSYDKANENKVIINGISMKTDENFTDLLGAEVSFIYSFVKDDDSRNELFHYYVSASNKLTVLREDYVDFINNNFIYEIKDSENKELKVSQTASYIKNGSNVDYDNTIFNFNLGDISLISTQSNGTYDVVIINEAEVYTAGIVDKTYKKVYDEYTTSDYVDFSKSLIKYEIIDSNGNEIGFDNIIKGDILTVYEGPDRTKVIVNRDYYTGVVESVDSEGFYIDGIEYKCNYYGAARTAAIAPGNTITAYFDAYGYVTNISLILSDENTFAYLVKLGPVKFGMYTKPVAKLYTKEGSFVEYVLADNVTVNGVFCKNKTYQQIENLILGNNSSYNGIVNYKIVDGEIKTLETAKLYNEFSDSDDGLCLRYESKARDYFSASKNFEYEAYYNNSTVFFRVPIDPINADEDDFAIIDSKYFVNGEPYTVSGYVTNKEDVEAAAIVIAEDPALSEFGVYDVICAVEKVSTAVNENGELIKKISVLKSIYGDSKKQRDLYTRINDTIVDQINNYSISDIKSGDIIKFSCEKDGRIRKFTLFYRYINGSLVSYANDVDSKKDNSTNVSSITHSNRIMQSKLISVRNGYIEVENHELYSLSNMQIVVLEAKPNYVKASQGEISDLILNKDCIVHMISHLPRLLIICK